MTGSISSRRIFLGRVLRHAPSALLLSCLPAGASKVSEDKDDVSPAEDLMREHGALNRILLIYDEVSHRLNTGASVDPKTVSRSAAIIKSFIEDYHEKLEEQHLFPRFDKAHKLTDLVAALRRQHEVGRVLTAQILKDAGKVSLADKADRSRLATNLNLFVRMYRPHEAREDTILFPAFRQLIGEKEYKELGEQFEDKEHELFGKDGFEENVRNIAEIEKQLGIYDLARFTPKLD